MEITNVQVFKYNVESSSLKAFCKVTLNDELVLTGLKVVDGKKGLFVSMPAQADSEGEYYDIYFPITAAFREKLTKAVLKAYDKELEKPAKKNSKKNKKRYEEEEDDE